MASEGAPVAPSRTAPVAVPSFPASVALPGDDVPRRAEFDVEAPLDRFAQLGGVPPRLLAGVQHDVQHLLLST